VLVVFFGKATAKNRFGTSPPAPGGAHAESGPHAKPPRLDRGKRPEARAPPAKPLNSLYLTRPPLQICANMALPSEVAAQPSPRRSAQGFSS